MRDITEKIYEAHKNAIYNFFYQSTLNKEISQDLTQETFLKAFKYFNSYKGDSSMKTWLFAIAKNNLKTYKSKNKAFLEVDIEKSGVFSECKSIESYDEKSLIQSILNKLTDKEKTFIILRDINQYSYREIAEIMNFTQGQVKMGLHRARKKFKELYIEIENKI